MADLAEKFKQSLQGQAIEKQVSETYNKMKTNTDVTINKEYEQLDHYATGWFKQVEMLTDILILFDNGFIWIFSCNVLLIFRWLLLVNGQFVLSFEIH